MNILMVVPYRGFNENDIDIAVKNTGWNITGITTEAETLVRGSRSITHRYAANKELPIFSPVRASDITQYMVNLVNSVDGVMIFWEGGGKKIEFILGIAKNSSKPYYIHTKEDDDDD